MFTQASHVRAFMLGGKAIFTIRSLKTGKHFTYKITKKEDRASVRLRLAPRVHYFVGVLGGDNSSDLDYHYLGMIQEGFVGQSWSAVLRRTPASPRDFGNPSISALNYVLHHVFFKDQMPPDCEIRHEGRCGRCARRLTHPTSLILGIGPECGAEAHAAYEGRAAA